MFLSSHIFVFWFLVFWSLSCVIFIPVFFRLAHLALQNVNKDYVIFSYFRNFIAKSDQKPKTKTKMNETLLKRYMRSSHHMDLLDLLSKSIEFLEPRGPSFSKFGFQGKFGFSNWENMRVESMIGLLFWFVRLDFSTLCGASVAAFS